MKRGLSDRKLQTLKPKAKQYDVMDGDVRGLGVRVGKTAKTFILLGRFPGHLTRRRLGDYGVMTLAEARDKARDWRKLLSEGKDPSIEEEKRRQAELRKHENKFGQVAETYFEDLERRKLRRAGEVERDMRREFARWWDRPITALTRHDVIAVVEAAIKRKSPWQAHHILSYASRFFNWAIERGVYGLEVSPCAGIKPARLIGAKEGRTRVLDDGELKALWKAADELGYPFGQLVQMLTLTGQRSEVAGARWSEIDLPKKLWNIPATRMKADAAHVVPLTDDVLVLLETLPEMKRATTCSRRPWARPRSMASAKAKRASIKRCWKNSANRTRRRS